MVTARPEDSSGFGKGNPAVPVVPAVGRISMPPGGGPTVPRRLLGAQLRRLREERGIILEDAGEVIRASGSKQAGDRAGRLQGPRHFGPAHLL